MKAKAVANLNRKLTTDLTKLRTGFGRPVQPPEPLPSDVAGGRWFKSSLLHQP